MSRTTKDACRVCGREANDKCSGCHDALYCSVSCQRFDWKILGHKPLCKGPALNRKIRNILHDLFTTEWQWLQNLSSREEAKLFNDRLRKSPLNHKFRGGEIALVLFGVNACVLCIHPGFVDNYGPEYYKNVMSPWYDRHKTFLSEQGFTVEYIDHPVFVSGQSLMLDYGGAAVFMNSNSPKIDLVTQIFKNKRGPAPFLWSGEEMVTWHDMMDCFSFKTTREGDQASGSGAEYHFQFPRQVFGHGEVCCSPCLEIKTLVDPLDADALGEHFHKSYSAATKFGFYLELVIQHQQDWPDDALARAWWAACGRRKATFDEWINEENGALYVCPRLGNDKFNRIIHLVHEM
jgi:hypothetical protein